jgi:RNA polymerase sigma-70 factor (ECF subfamily)
MIMITQPRAYQADARGATHKVFELSRPSRYNENDVTRRFKGSRSTVPSRQSLDYANGGWSAVSEQDSVVITWVQGALAGDQLAFEEIVHAFQNAVYNLCYRMLGERTEAEDAAQEAFLRAYTHLNRYDPARPFKTWLLTIASNHCIDRIRKRRMQYLSLDDEPLAASLALSSDEPEPEDAALHRERSAEIQNLLDTLNAEYRAAVILRYWYDYSYQEIAAMLNTTESAVKSRLFRARKALEDQLVRQSAKMISEKGRLNVG